MDQEFTQDRPDYPQLEKRRQPSQNTTPIRRHSHEVGRRIDNRATEEKVVEKGVFGLLDQMENILAQAKKMPFSDQVLVEREELHLLIRSMREELPEELRQARWLLQQNRQLIAEARKEAEQIMREAEQQMTRMIDEHEVSQQAKQHANEIMSRAEQEANKVHDNVMGYAKNVLSDLEDQLTEMLVFIQKNKKEIR
ncbi:MAG: hypothetical protein Q4P65_02855 [Eubacteriales bacterium]|nr:hypothetical protein [Eubacteriales bacterium]